MGDRMSEVYPEKFGPRVKQRMTDVFKEISGKSSDKNVLWNELAISSHQIGQKLRGRLTECHIQRLCHYFKIPRRVKLKTYLARFRLLLTSGSQGRLQFCFGLLDADGDGEISTRDIFAVLGSTTAPNVIDAVFTNDDTRLGIDFDRATMPPEVVSVQPGSAALKNKILPFDRLVAVNGSGIETMGAEQVWQVLGDGSRPLHLRLLRGLAGSESRPRGMIAVEDFETLLTSLTQRGGKGINFEEFKVVFQDREPAFLVQVIEALTGTTVDTQKATQPDKATKAHVPMRPSPTGGDKSQKEEDLRECMTRHEEELKELRELKYADPVEMEAYIKTFNLLCDERKQISQTATAQRAEQIFGFRCIRLAGRFHELVDFDGSGSLGVSEWVRTRERLFHASWNMKMEFAFSLYDIDGDGLISVDDAVEIRRELQRLADLKRCKIEELQAPLCMEMRWLYDYILEESWLNNLKGLTLGAFRQMHPNPVIFNTLIENLDQLGKKGALLRQTGK